MNKHTPTPWRAGKVGDCIVSDQQVRIGRIEEVRSEIDYYGGYIVAESMAPENRDFILTACNSHEALVEALKRIASGQCFVYPRTLDPVKDEELIARMNYARDALKLAGIQI